VEVVVDVVSPIRLGVDELTVIPPHRRFRESAFSTSKRAKQGPRFVAFALSGACSGRFNNRMY